MSDLLDGGRLEDHPFAVLAGLVFRESRTGELTLESGNRHRRVWFLGGNPVAVVSDDPEDHLAQVLLEHGKIGQEEAQRLAGVPETREGLAAATFIPKDTLTWGVKYRFVNLCYDLFRWEEGDYSFRAGNPPRELSLLKVPANTLIVKGVGYLSRAVLAELVPDDAVFAPGPVPAADARYLGPDERSLLEECHAGSTVGETLAAGWDDIDRARQQIYALLCLGILELRPAATAAAEVALDEPEIDLEEPEPETATETDDAFGAPAEAEASPAGFSLPDETFTEPSFGFPDATPDAAAGGEEGAFAPAPAAKQAPGPDSGSQRFDRDESAAGFGGSFGGSFDEGPAAEAPEGSPEHGEPEPAEEPKARVVPRLITLVVGGVAIVLAFGAAAWWYVGGSEPPAPRPIPPLKRLAPPAPAPVPAPSPAPAPSPVVAPPPAPARAPIAATPAQPAAQAPAPARTPPPQTAQTPPKAPAPAAPPAQPATPVAAAGRPAAAPPASKPAPLLARAAGETQSPRESSERYSNGLSVMRAGDLDGAAAIWESQLAEEHARDLTILVETACEHETVRAAFRGLAPHGSSYLVTKQVKGRACYRICLGTFSSREAAARALTALPQEYRGAGAAVRTVADVLSRDR
jgi:hypothetical protein